jgi:16S rRNA (guanine966-N2)-methyltransferase
MSILQQDIPGATVLDLFAGSGALGLEALSRGAVSADFVERSAPSLRSLRANIDKLDAGDLSKVHRADALKFIERLDLDAFHIAFADPPYTEGAAARIAAHWLQLPFASILSVEHAASEAMPAGGKTRRYGTSAITIYRSEE